MRDLLILAIVVGLVPLILRHAWIGILAWFWVGLMSPHRLAWGFMQTFPIAVIIGGVTMAALLFSKEKRALPVTREMLLLYIFAAYITMTTMFSWVPESAWGQWNNMMKILLMTFITPVLIYGSKRVISLVLVVALSIGFYGLKGGVFSLGTGGAHMVLGPTGSFLGGNTNLGLAMTMVLPLLLVSARLFRERWVDFGILTPYSSWVGLALYGVFWLTAIATVFTYSRGALLGLAAVAPFLFFKMRRKGLMVLSAILVVGVVGVTLPDRLVERAQTIATYQEDHSAMQRLQAWGVNWNIAVENPILGSGFNNAAMPHDRWLSYANWVESWAMWARAAHSIHFQLLGHHGFGGYTIFMLLLGCTFLTLSRLRRVAKAMPEKHWVGEYAWAIQVSLIAYLVAGSFLDVAYFNLFYAYVAIAVIMRREIDEAVSSGSSANNHGHCVGSSRAFAA